MLDIASDALNEVALRPLLFEVRAVREEVTVLVVIEPPVSNLVRQGARLTRLTLETPVVHEVRDERFNVLADRVGVKRCEALVEVCAFSWSDAGVLHVGRNTTLERRVLL